MLATLRHRDFALLWVAGLVSVAGDNALIVALPLHAYELTGSAAAAGVFAAAVLPRVLLGSVAGVFVDRWDRKRTMVATDLLRAALLLPLLAAGSADLLWLVFLVRAALGTVRLFFDPAESALLPRLVGEERLVAANALNALNNNVGMLVGPAVGGLLYARYGLGVVVAADAATFLASAALVAAIRSDARPDAGSVADAASAWGRFWREWGEGLRLVGRNRALRTVFAASFLGAAEAGTFAAGLAPLAVDVLRGGEAGAGLLLSAQAVGGLAAGALIAGVAARRPPRLLFGGALVGLGLSDLGLANAANLAPPGTAALGVAVLFMVAAGVPEVASRAAGTGLLQGHAADAFRGRVFGAFGATQAVATLLGLGIGGPAVDAVGVVPVVSAGAAISIAGGLLALARLPREADHAAATEPVTTPP